MRPPYPRHFASPVLVLAGIAISTAVTFNILLPVVPVLLERSGPHGAAGAATAALFIGAVAGELVTPRLMARWSSSRLLVAGQLMTALPSLIYVIPHVDALLMLSAAAARGIGMGVTIVVSVALVGELAPPERRGRTIGYFGFALSAPGIVVPSIGVALQDAGHVGAVALIAFVIGIAGALLVFMLPRRPEPAHPVSTSLLAALRRPGMLRLYAGFVLVSCSFGAVITFAPVALPAGGFGSAAAFLFVAGAARALSRWLAGVVSDRRPGRLVLMVSIAITLAGLIALASTPNPAVVIFAAIAFGSGYGAVQTAVYMAMTARGSSAHRNTISALWNSGIDLGASLGGSVLGLAAARYGYATAIWAIPVLLVIALPLILAPAASSAGPEGVEPAGSRVEEAGATLP
ncbi:MAG TPA: MFS transporter [Candidatus Dormibacteraeota bacterium]|nr:MFS transporter [Candidatus Dormibacteraeota bacterium]